MRSIRTGQRIDSETARKVEILRLILTNDSNLRYYTIEYSYPQIEFAGAGLLYPKNFALFFDCTQNSLQGFLSNFGGNIMDRMFFIVNPVAGSGKCNALFSECEAILRERGIEYIVKKTEYKGHAVKIAEDAIKNGEKFIIAAGGDGTVNEISSVICQNPNVKLGILPFGTGNDLSGMMNLPSEPEAAIDLLLSGEAKYIDMGIANGTKFTNVCGIGFDVDVLINTERHKKGKAGPGPRPAHRNESRACCFYAGIAKIKTDSIQYEGDIIISVAGNGKRFGGGMLVNPDAEVDDGLFDLCIVRWVSLFTFLRLLPLFIKGKHKNKAPVTNIRTQSFTIETDSECIVELDGELIEKTPLTCSIIKNALRVVRP